MTEARTGIVIPQHGCCKETLHCCSSLLRHHQIPLKIVVVDDGSSAADLKTTKRWLPAEITLLSQPHQGITTAWNRGIQELQTPFLILLNNDVITLGPWIEEVEQLLTANPRQLIGAERYSAVAWKFLTRHFFIPADHPWLLAGWCLAFHRQSANSLGSFDEGMRLYWSDTDWQFRWLRRYGDQSDIFKILTTSNLRHRGHVSTRRFSARKKWWHQDCFSFFYKWRLLQRYYKSSISIKLNNYGM